VNGAAAIENRAAREYNKKIYSVKGAKKWLKDFRFTNARCAAISWKFYMGAKALSNVAARK